MQCIAPPSSRPIAQPPTSLSMTFCGFRHFSQFGFILFIVCLLTLTIKMPDQDNANPGAGNPGAVATPRFSARFSQPQQFSFKPEDWPQRFSRYRSAARLDAADGDRQVNALVCHGTRK